jgi:hypothetical protein
MHRGRKCRVLHCSRDAKEPLVAASPFRQLIKSASNSCLAIEVYDEHDFTLSKAGLVDQVMYKCSTPSKSLAHYRCAKRRQSCASAHTFQNMGRTDCRRWLGGARETWSNEAQATSRPYLRLCPFSFDQLTLRRLYQTIGLPMPF